MSAKCPCCHAQTTKRFQICVNCVCYVPDCESIGLFHSRCFKHWRDLQPVFVPELCLDVNCWQCKIQPKRIQNYQELEYCYQLVKMPYVYPYWEYMEQLEKIVKEMKNFPSQAQTDVEEVY
jgi:hypothetical protein